MSFYHLQGQRKKQQGSILILTAVSAFALAGVAALALDSSLIFVSRAELQNAADAGALAGTQMLYSNDGSVINGDPSGAVYANQVAFDAATANLSLADPVEVIWASGQNNGSDVERGHWSFLNSQFTPNDSLAPVSLFDATTAELDADLNFINAVRVTTRRQATAVQSILANIFGIQETAVTATAVGYIGFAGTLNPTEADQPIAICEDRLRNSDGEYSCNVGTFIPSADNQVMSETGGWTNFEQPEGSCGGGTNASELRPLICSTGNANSLQYGEPMQAQGGQVQSVYKDLYDCWEAASNKNTPWNLTLPVVRCTSSNVGPCEVLVGAVNLNVIYMLDQANKINEEAPTQMACPQYMIDAGDCTDAGWSNADPDGIVRWNNFVDFFNIDKPDGTPAHYNEHAPSSGWRQKTIYFLPDCSVHAPTGRTGGENFGVLSKIPVLVE